MPEAKSNGVTLGYALQGEGPPLLMITGFRRSRVVWMPPLIEVLKQHFTLVLFDTRGTGDSDKPEDGYTIQAFADDSAGLLRHLKLGPASVFGVSMGGMIAQQVAARHPDVVRALAIGCSHGGNAGSVKPERRIWELLRLMPQAGMDAREVARLQEEAYVTDNFREQNRATLEALFEVVNQNPTPPHAVKGHLAAIEAFEGEADLPNIAAPTLVITGREDKLIPAANSELLAERIPGAKLVLLPDAAHFFWIEKPVETAAHLTGFFQKHC